MYVVEIGILHSEKSLVHVSFYRKDEALRDITKEQIIAGIYSIVPEIFRDHVLKRLNIAKYTILFNGFDAKPNKMPDEGQGMAPAGSAKGSPPVNPGRLVLAYAIVDLMSENLDKAFIKSVQAKIKQLGDEFIALYGNKLEAESTDYGAFKQQILAVFKDMLKKPEDRFDEMWHERSTRRKTSR